MVFTMLRKCRPFLSPLPHGSAFMWNDYSIQVARFGGNPKRAVFCSVLRCGKGSTCDTHSQHCLRVRAARHGGGRSFCQTNKLQCDGEGAATYKTFRVLAWLFFLVYPVGVPCFFALTLHFNYDHLFDVARRVVMIADSRTPLFRGLEQVCSTLPPTPFRLCHRYISRPVNRTARDESLTSTPRL